MSTRSYARREVRTATIVGATSSGVSEKVASSLEATVEAAFRKSGSDVHVRGMRLIPSTKVDLGGGRFQILASTVVDIAGRKGARERVQAFDSVVTVEGPSSNGQILKGVVIPALEPVEG